MYLKKLTDLVCTEKQINDDLKELRFGTKVFLEGRTIGFYTGWYEERIISGTDERYKLYEFQYNGKNRCLKKISEIEIIGNPLELHHLMMYCSKKGWPFAIGSQGRMMGNKQKDGSYYEVQLDNTKPLSQQSEEVLKNIFEALAS